jgi:membrane-associated phospholipid phosphatase
MTKMFHGKMNFDFSATGLVGLLLPCILMLSCCVPAAGQRPDVQPSESSTTSLPDAPHVHPDNQADEDHNAVTLGNTPLHILKDQAAIWTSPVRIRTNDLVWLVPLAGATGAAIATDHHTMSSVVSHNPGFNQTNTNWSNGLLGGILFVPAALYLGDFHEAAQAHEAGILGGEAVVDAAIVEQGMKLIFWRERPDVDNAQGHFFQGSAGPNSSFPSAHSTLAWATAAVIAGEYPTLWTQIAVYTAATGVSVTRVLGQQHFPSDVLVGGAAGWLIGHYVYRTRHRYQRGGKAHALRISRSSATAEGQ